MAPKPDPGTKGTIDDAEWARLQRRAQNAEAKAGRRWTDPEVVRQRLASQSQQRRSRWS